MQSSGALNAHTGNFEVGFRESQLGDQGSFNDSSNNSGEADSRILDWGLELSHTNGNENAPSSTRFENTKAGTSLSGATSLVRELQMVDAPHTPSNSQNSHTAQAHTGSDPTDRTPNNAATPAAAKASSQGSVDKTPRPRKPFSRLIKLPITAQSYYDPYNDATHNVEYASRVSGHDFATQPHAKSQGVTSLPETVRASFRSGGEAEVVSANTSAGGAERDFQAAPPQQQQRLPEDQATAGAKQVDARFMRPVVPYGRLVSTADSFAHIAIAVLLIVRQMLS